MTLAEDRTAPAVADCTARLEVLMDAHDGGPPGRFPHEAWQLLRDAGVPGATAQDDLSVTDEQDLVRAVSRIDVGLGRILDGHLNAVQRLRVQVDDDELAARELHAVAHEGLRLGVWGADPAPGDGEPARLVRQGDAWTLHGVKTFCSGAGGADRAFVLARGPDDTAPLRLAYVDVATTATTLDDRWFGGAGMRGSASHRVVFDGAPVAWIAGDPGALLRQPWISQDGMRTAAGWAGGADRIVGDTIELLRRKGADGALEGLAVARLRTAQRAMDLWLAAGAEAVVTGGGDVAEQTLMARGAIAEAVRLVLDEASRVLGSRPFATGGRIERARRDLATYLLQHRLEPMLARAGRTHLTVEDRS